VAFQNGGQPGSLTYAQILMGKGDGTFTPSTTYLPSICCGTRYSGQSTDPVTFTVTSSQGYGSAAKVYCEGLAPGDIASLPLMH
jgi:hypothetical protein